MAETSTPVASPPARRRPGLRDLALSLVLLLAIIGVVLAVQYHGGTDVRVIDPSSTYAGARNVAAYPVRTPQSLPARWRPTSARTSRPQPDRLTLTVGFVTPKGEYAQLVESDLPRGQLLDSELSAGVRSSGVVEVGGVSWERFPSRRQGDRTIVRTDGGVTLLVSGSAGLDELRVLALSLR